MAGAVVMQVSSEALGLASAATGSCLKLIPIADTMMHPTCTIGDNVICNSVDKALIPDRLYAIQVNGEVLVRRLIPKHHGTVADIFADSAPREPAWAAIEVQDIGILGRVLWICNKA